MKILTLVARILIGLTFLVFGVIGLLPFLKQPPMPPGAAKNYVDALSATPYIKVVSCVQVVSAVLFLINRFVPLALTLIAPVIVNILMFHLFMALASIGPGLLVTVCWFIIYFRHRAAFAGIFAARS
jgi:peptidoglycan biosynthesis protein MviN/MurJ (putative lipid II flippase)